MKYDASSTAVQAGRPRRVSGTVRRLAVPSAATDEDLVARIIGGEPWAEEALYRRHAPKILRVTTRLLRSRDDAEDVLHDTFISAFQNIHRLEDRAALAPWLMQVAVRHVYRRLRRRRMLSRLGFRPLLDAKGESTVHYDGAASTDAGPDTKMDIRIVGVKLQQVSADCQLAWLLRYVEGYTLPEVALACGCSLATAKRRIRAAQEHLVSEEGGWT